jgi:Fe-S oxidoreductase
MQKVKALLDPENRLNRGKIAAPPGLALTPVDGAPLRGTYDADISAALLSRFPKAQQCNGNGLCFSAMPDEAMCPSYKITGDRKHSPKGRAALLREWLRLKSIDEPAAHRFEGIVHDALSGCLSCKACTSVCPIHVNIPDMKSDFLDGYYARRGRPLRDYLIGAAESLSAVLSCLPFSLPMPDMGGLVDLPRAARPSLRTLMKRHGFRHATALRVKKAARPVLIVQDAYTSFYEPRIVLSVLQFFKALGFDPLLLPFKDSGKGWHVRGFKDRFRRIALRNIEHYELWAKALTPMIGIDPSLTLVYRDEYAKVLGHSPRFRIHLLQEWLADFLKHNPAPPLRRPGKGDYTLFLHCTEKTAVPQSVALWADIFGRFGISVRAQETGCCGMAGAYGHEAEHLDLSKGLYGLSWAGKMGEGALATGYSCRCQTARMESYTPQHPVALLNSLL